MSKVGGRISNPISEKELGQLNMDDFIELMAPENKTKIYARTSIGVGHVQSQVFEAVS
jgi:hypothetical protein